jgi:3-oxoacyl-[acyl-carrier-protein] synthase-3
MRFQHVCLESIAVALPDEVWSSAMIEQRLAPMYERLKLPEGRLELMTGIRERRHWPVNTRPSDASARAGRALLQKTKLKPEQLGVFINASVSRDMLEPATASFAHRKIGLPNTMQILDVSNACLGVLNSFALLAGMIESGQILAGMVVAGENGRGLIEETLRHLVQTPLTRNEIKPFFANLTIGSGAVAAILCHDSLLKGRPAHRLIGGIARAATQHSELCQGDTHGADSLAMQTNSEELLIAGVDLAGQTWRAFTQELGWDATVVDRFIGHQVGSVHRRKLYETLGLDLQKDFSTFETLGNMGSASLPATLAMAVEAGAILPGNRVALLGIGSGLNCMMLGLEW